MDPKEETMDPKAMQRILRTEQTKDPKAKDLKAQTTFQSKVSSPRSCKRRFEANIFHLIYLYNTAVCAVCFLLSLQHRVRACAYDRKTYCSGSGSHWAHNKKTKAHRSPHTGAPVLRSTEGCTESLPPCPSGPQGIV